MNNSIFRQKNIDKINSPESLNDYVRVTNPSVWIILIGTVILIIGALIFGTIGKIDTNVNAVAEAIDGVVNVYIDEADVESLIPGMVVKVDGAELIINSVADRPLKASEIDEYLLHKGNMEGSLWLYKVAVDGKLNEGVYPATITVEKTSPMSYIFN